MAQQENSFIDDSKHSEIHSGDLLSREMRVEELGLQDDKSCCDDVGKSMEQIVDKLSESEVKKSSTDSQHRDSHASSECHHSTSQTRWHSTPSVHCCVKLSDYPADSGTPMRSCESGKQSLMLAVTELLSMVTVGQCDQEEVINECNPVHCQTCAADDDNTDCDADIANSDMFISCNKNVPLPSPNCREVENNVDENASADKTRPYIELTAASPDVTASEEIDCEPADCLPATDVSDSHRHHCQTTESVCCDLSEMVQKCAIDKKQVLNGTASDADISDSFDLDAAAKDLERAVSAGMLDFLLESCEDSDEDVNTEQMCEELGEWSPASLSDEDDNGSSESTLADGGDDSIVGIVDEESDEDVSRRHERIKRRLKLTDNGVDGVTDTADNKSTSDDDDDDDCDDNDDDVLRRHERIKNHSKSAYNDDDDDDTGTAASHDDNDYNAANGETRTADCMKSTIDDDDDVLRRHERIKRHLKSTDNVDGDHSTADDVTAAADIKSTSNDAGDSDDTDVKDDIVLKPCERVKSIDYDDDSCMMDVDISALDINCTHDDEDNDDDDDDDNAIVTQHARVKQLLESAAGDAVNRETREAELANANTNCSCVDDNVSSRDQRWLINADDVDDNTAADDGATGVHCTGDALLAVTMDRVSTSEKCVSVPNTDQQSVLCRNVESMSSAVDEYRKEDVQDKLNAVTVDTCEAESAVCPGILSPHPQPLSDIQNTNTRCNYSGETSLLLEELGAGSTSTPSTCSHHSLTRHSVIEWREGIYNGLCRHSDGSEIRT